MQFPTWLVSKIRKPILVISIVVAMASLLIACGDTTNQAQTTSGDTTNQAQTTSILAWINAAMSVIVEQRQLSYAAVQQIYSLEQNGDFQGCPADYDYYGNAKSYYTSYVQSNFNGWLMSLANEAQNGQSLNTSTDQTQISIAFQANYAFTTWANQVYNYFTGPGNSCSQGQGQGGYLIATFPKAILPDFEPIDVSKVDLSMEDPVASGLKQLSDALGHFVSIPTPQGGGSSLFPAPTLNDVLGAITNSEWPDFCGAAQANSC